MPGLSRLSLADARAVEQALIHKKVDAVYGSRYMKYADRGKFINFIGSKHAGQSWLAYGGGQSLSLIALFTTGRYISDTVTALKLFRAEVIRKHQFVTRGFELDHEITARLAARGKRIVEVPISYAPRTREEGKKIGARDWCRSPSATPPTVTPRRRRTCRRARRAWCRGRSMTSSASREPRR